MSKSWGGRRANKHQQPISGFTDRIHERPMLIKVSYDLGHPLKVSACCFIQAFHDRVLMLPALDDKERIALSPDFRLLLPCLLVSNCPKSSQEAISSNILAAWSTEVDRGYPPHVQGRVRGKKSSMTIHYFRCKFAGDI